MLPRRINGYRRIALLEGRLFCLPVLTWLGALGFSRCAAAQQVIVIVTVPSIPARTAIRVSNILPSADQKKGSAREFEKPLIGVDLSVLPFLGLLALGFPTLNADLRQLCAANSAVSERLEHRNSGIVRSCWHP